MKQLPSIFLFAFALLFPLFAGAQVPAGFSYQAVIRDAEGKPIASKEVFARISLLKENVQDQSKAIYSETHNLKTTSSGLMTANVGMGEKLSGHFDSIVWSTPTYLLVEVDLDGSSSFPIVSMQQLLSVPYALYSPMSPELKSIIEQQKQTILGLQNSLKTLRDEFDDLTPEKLGERVVKDIDGNVYPTVMINGKRWMKTSLLVTKLKDGTPLTEVKDSIEWGKKSQEGALTCYYKNDEENLRKFGRIYTYNTLKDGKLCPEGWNLPTLAEIKELVNMYPDPKQWKSTDTLYWKKANEYTDEIGFSARGGGNRDQNAKFDTMDLKQSVIFWTQTESHDRMAYVLQFTEIENILVQPQLKGLGGYVRCLKGEPKPDPKATIVAKIEPPEAASWENGDPSGTYTVGHWMWLKLNIKLGYRFIGWFDEKGNPSEGEINPGKSNTEGPCFISEKGGTLIAKFEKRPSEQNVTDGDGVKYVAKQINGILWMTKNLEKGSRRKAKESKYWKTWASDDIAKRESAYMYKDFKDENKAMGIYVTRKFIANGDAQCPDGYQVPTELQAKQLVEHINQGQQDAYERFNPQFNGYVDENGVLKDEGKVGYYAVFTGGGDLTKFISIDKDTKKAELHIYNKNEAEGKKYAQYGYNIRCVQ